MGHSIAVCLLGRFSYEILSSFHWFFKGIGLGSDTSALQRTIDGVELRFELWY